MLLSEIEADLKALSRGTSRFGHELRTIVTAVLGEADTLREEIDRIPSDLQEAVRLLSEDASRLREIVSAKRTVPPLDGRDS